MANSYKDGPLPRVSIGAACSSAPYRQDNEFRASFRVMSFYDIGTDTIQTRIDVVIDGKIDGKTDEFHLVHGDRAGVLLQSSSPVVPGEREARDGELQIPRGFPAFEGFSVKAEPGDLSAALRGLADAIDAFMARKDGARPKPLAFEASNGPFGP